MIRLTILAAAAALAAISAATAEPKVKKSFESVRPAGELASCFAERLGYLANPSVLPEVGGVTRVLFTNFGRTVTRIGIVAGERRHVLLRGVSGGRVVREVRRCL
jgi:hypothetical protein